MILSEAQLTSALHGAAYTENNGESLGFHRFFPSAEGMYLSEAPEFAGKLTACPGIRLDFTTDSPFLFLKVRVGCGSTRSYFAFDLLENGIYRDSLANFDPRDMTDRYARHRCELGEFEKTFPLSPGENSVSLLFPALVSVRLVSLSLADGASFSPSPARGIYLALGDSITQGYDCLYPRHRYPHRIASALGLYEHNLAIGGECFRPGLAAELGGLSPSLITVAYGTNDWRHSEYSDTARRARDFLFALSDTFPEKKIFVLSPILRMDRDLSVPFGPFRSLRDLLLSICNSRPNLSFIDGSPFLPPDPSLFGDGNLHPNDRGFHLYADALLPLLK